MSDHAHDTSGHPPAEPDDVRTWTVAAVGVVSLVIFIIAGGLTVAWMHRQQRALNPDYPVMPAAAGQRKVGIVEQQLFENANRAQALREQQQRRLRSAGWVDRERGLVHLPVDRAMELVARGERP